MHFAFVPRYLLRKAIDYHNLEFVQVTTVYPKHAGHVPKLTIVQNVSFPDISGALIC